jgi:hypothetical protein
MLDQYLINCMAKNMRVYRHAACNKTIHSIPFLKPPNPEVELENTYLYIRNHIL